MDVRLVAHIILILNFGHFVGSYSRHVEACRTTPKFVWGMLDVYFQNRKNGVGFWLTLPDILSSLLWSSVGGGEDVAGLWSSQQRC